MSTKKLVFHLSNFLALVCRLPFRSFLCFPGISLRGITVASVASHLSVSASSSVLPRRLQAGCSTPAAPLATSAPQTRQHTARHIPGAPRSSIGTSRRIKRRQTY